MDKNKNNTANNKLVPVDLDKVEFANRPKRHHAAERFVATGEGLRFTPPEKKGEE